jgi:hypothetical protein
MADKLRTELEHDLERGREKLAAIRKADRLEFQASGTVDSMPFLDQQETVAQIEAQIAALNRPPPAPSRVAIENWPG